MTPIGQPEKVTQNRVIALFRDELHYHYLGDWTDRPNNSNIEENLLTAYLSKNDYTPAQISSAIYKLRTEADKKPPECLEYVVVHELAHLLEHSHNSRFIALMDQFMPSWRNHREELNRAPLGHEEWAY